MDYKDIVLIILVIGMLFIATKVYKNNNIEKFEPEQVNLIKEEINRQYNMDIESIRNLGAISKSLLTGTNYHSTESANPGTLTIPADTIIEGETVIKDKTVIEGDTVLKGKVEFENKDTMLMDILPKYMVIAWANNEGIPKGWAVCDGKKYILNDDGTATDTLENGVQTPDLRGRFVLGAGEGKTYQYDTGKVDAEGKAITEERVLTTRKLGDNNGEEQHTLTIAEMPWHNHGVYTGSGEGCTPEGRLTQWAQCSNPIKKTDVMEKVGGNQPHNNMPPFYVLIYIMKL